MMTVCIDVIDTTKLVCIRIAIPDSCQWTPHNAPICASIKSLLQYKPHAYSTLHITVTADMDGNCQRCFLQ